MPLKKNLNLEKILLSLIIGGLLFSNSSQGNKIEKDSKQKSSSIKIVFISDTHGKHNEISIPDADLLIFCGDMCSRGLLSEVQDFAKLLKELPHKYKIIIAGNHDKAFEDKKYRSSAERLIQESGAIYLNDSGTEIEGIKIWGSPIQPWFLDWAFNRQRGEEIQKHWDMIPDDTDLLITHGPPHGILDKNQKGQKTGCKELFKKVKEVNPKVHAFGHIHEGYGKIKKNKTTFINASNLNVRYQPVNPPIVINWKSK